MNCDLLMQAEAHATGTALAQGAGLLAVGQRLVSNIHNLHLDIGP